MHTHSSTHTLHSPFPHTSWDANYSDTFKQKFHLIKDRGESRRAVIHQMARFLYIQTYQEGFKNAEYCRAICLTS